MYGWITSNKMVKKHAKFHMSFLCLGIKIKSLFFWSTYLGFVSFAREHFSTIVYMTLTFIYYVLSTLKVFYNQFRPPCMAFLGLFHLALSHFLQIVVNTVETAENGSATH